MPAHLYQRKRPGFMDLIAEIIALDLLTLREHTELSGDSIDQASLRLSLEPLLKHSKIITIYRDQNLAAYTMLHQQAPGDWFVTGFGTHPQYRTAPVFEELLTQLLLFSHQINTIKSHVYKTNKRSMAFHLKLGFKISNENEKAVEFFASHQDLSQNSTLKKLQLKALTRTPGGA